MPRRVRSSVFHGVYRTAPLLLAVAAALAACASKPAGTAADLVLRNGRIATVDSLRPEVQALAVSGDTIVAVGSDEQVARYIGPQTEVIDLAGRRAIPGFVESHGHFMGLGASRMELDVMHVHTWDDIVNMVAAAAKDQKPGAWILGRGWHQEKWDHAPARMVAGFPTNDRLNQAAPNNPVYLTHASGHASIANAKALQLAGITARTPNPPGGEIIKDARGRPTGMLVDAAQGLVSRALKSWRDQMTPEQREARAEKQAELAAQEAVSKGVTTFEDQGESFQTIDMLRKLEQEGKLPVRLYVLVSPGAVHRDSVQALVSSRVIDAAHHHFTVRAVGEIIADGALGSHSAWMMKPYDDEPNTTGLNVTPMPRIREIAEIAMAHGFQISTHAIGDRANHEVLDLYAELLHAHPDSTDLRWRIEHAQHVLPQDLPRFARLGVIASMQGIHACSDGPYVVKRLGEERARDESYMWQTLWKSGAVVTNGTDVPVEDIDPIASFHCSVTRELKDGSRFFPQQDLTRAEALRSYTLNGAYAAFQEHEIGSLAPGKLADITILSKDIMTVPDDSIMDAKVDYTIVGGKVVYEVGEGNQGN